MECILKKHLTYEDAYRIAVVRRRTWPEKKELSLEEFARHIMPTDEEKAEPDSHAARHFVIRDGDAIVAHSHVFGREIGTSAGPMTILALARVCADPDHRGKGYGRDVVEAAFSVVDCELFPVCIYQTSYAVKPFYEKLGAHQIQNRIVNSLSDDPGKNPFWNELVMAYPKTVALPDGDIDLRGEGY